MTAKRKARILGVTQTMKEVARAKAQRLSAETSQLEKKRDAIIFCISNNNLAGHAFVSQMEKNLTNISIELESLARKKDQLVGESIRLMEQERIARERLTSARLDERRSQDERECLDWVSRQVVAGRKPGAGL